MSPGARAARPRGCLKTVFSDRLFESAAGPDGMACAPRHQAPPGRGAPAAVIGGEPQSIPLQPGRREACVIIKMAVRLSC